MQLHPPLPKENIRVGTECNALKYMLSREYIIDSQFVPVSKSDVNATIILFAFNMQLKEMPRELQYLVSVHLHST